MKRFNVSIPKPCLELSIYWTTCTFLENVVRVQIRSKRHLSKVSEDGNKEERCWKDGMLEGPATVEGANGDRLEFTYKAGVRGQ